MHAPLFHHPCFVECCVSIMLTQVIMMQPQTTDYMCYLIDWPLSTMCMLYLYTDNVNSDNVHMYGNGELVINVTSGRKGRQFVSKTHFNHEGHQTPQ